MPLGWSYSLDDCGNADPKKKLFADINWLGRNDDPGLLLYSRYVQALLIDDSTCGFASPDSVRPTQGQRCFRGMKMPRELRAKYPKGRTFLWTSFVSLSKREDVAKAFTKVKQAEKGKGLAQFLFTVDLPAYDKYTFKCWDLAPVSALEDEAEVLVPPMTQFEVADDPREDGDGVVRVPVRAVGQTMSDGLVLVTTVIVLPEGFAPGSDGHAVARAAFDAGLPCFHVHEAGDPAGKMGQVYNCAQALALFTDPADAAAWMAGAGDSKTLFVIVVSGAASERLLVPYFAGDTCRPCRLLVLCRDKARWEAAYAGFGRVSVTAALGDAAEFVRHEKWSDLDDEWRTMREEKPPAFDAVEYYRKGVGATGVLYGDPLGIIRPSGENQNSYDVAETWDGVPYTAERTQVTVTTLKEWQDLIDQRRIPMRPFDT